MVRRNRFIKWQTPARNAKSSFEGANPTPPSPMQRRRPPARTTIESKCTVGHHFFETMCPTAFLAPTLIAKTCFICTQPKHAFFLAQLALQGHRANGKKPLLGRVPGPKKRNPNGSKIWVVSKRILLLSGQKKSQKLDRALP